MSRQAGELLRHRLLQPGGAKEPRCMVEGLLAGPGAADHHSSSGSGSSRPGAAGVAPGLHASGGGFFPDLQAMLQQQGLLAA